jgi:hypothetical protein
MRTPRYPSLTKLGFLTKRGHDLHPKLIDLINEVISHMPHGLPMDAETRANYARDLYLETYEGKEPVVIPCLQGEGDRQMREFLYECTHDSPLRTITIADPENPDKPIVYLERYPLFETPELLAYIHFFRTSDEPHLHTHPWRSAYSTILAGGYTETRLRDMTLLSEGQGFCKINRPVGSFGSLTNTDQHFVTLPQTQTGERPCWTLFMHHRKWDYGWGFTENESVEAKVWDDLANNGTGENKTSSGTLFVTKEKGGGANDKTWWRMENGATRFIDKAHILRARFGLTKESYL